MAEKGHFGRRIPEPLFLYRTANKSRFIEDRAAHDDNVKKIQAHHPNYKKTIRRLKKERRFEKRVPEPKSAFVNLKNNGNFLQVSKRPHALLLMPWMAFGGAETLIINFSKELANNYRITFMTGLDSDHVWHGRFEEISNRIYHLSNLFDNRNLYLEFISNYIRIHDVEIIHMVHTNFAYEFLQELKIRHPKVKVILTMFNSRVDHFPDIKKHIKYIDAFTSDNSPVVREYKKLGIEEVATKVIPNGIDSTSTFNPEKFDKGSLRKKYNLKEDDIAVFFIGRLSEEKNPDVFVKVAKCFASDSKYKKLRFFIVGDGGMKSKIERSIQNLHNIEYLGYRSDIPLVLSVSDVFVLPSSIEGFPLSILEAMAMENISIASSVGAVPDIVKEGETGFVVSPGSVNEIVDSLYYLADNRGKMAKIQEKSRNAVINKYSSEILGKNYKKLYEDVVK